MRSMVEGAACRAENPLRQRYALPPPRAGEEKEECSTLVE
jgi:hypothetical protein